MTNSSTVLIVDDEPLGRVTLKSLLINEGYELLFAASGDEAIAQIQASRPDLVLLDVMMPEMDGFEVCRLVRADLALAEIPIIMVTALDDRASRLRGIEAGADDFVTKPFDRLELRTRVRTITRLNRYHRLLAERARLEWIVDQSQDGYVWLNNRDEILYVNPQARLFLELPDTRTALQLPRFLQVAQQHYRCEPEAAWAVWETTGVETLQDCYLIRPETPTSRAFWLRLTVLKPPFDADDSRIVRLQDVTAEACGWFDMRGFHDALRHKIRTPFTGILGSLELLVKKGSSLSGEAVAPLARTALESARRLYDTFSDVLGYLSLHSLSEIGSCFELARFDALVNEIASSLENIAVEVQCSQDLRQTSLPLSQRAVELILWELLENALKFHPEHKPSVQIRIFQADQGWVGLQVLDDGVHIASEHLPHLGQPYYQGEKYFTGESKGMGLGLATVAGLVWNAGGTWRIQNRPDGNGIQIELMFPMWI